MRGLMRGLLVVLLLCLVIAGVAAAQDRYVLLQHPDTITVYCPDGLYARGQVTFRGGIVVDCWEGYRVNRVYVPVMMK